MASATTAERRRIMALANELYERTNDHRREVMTGQKQGVHPDASVMVVLDGMARPEEQHFDLDGAVAKFGVQGVVLDLDRMSGGLIDAKDGDDSGCGKMEEVARRYREFVG